MQISFKTSWIDINILKNHRNSWLANNIGTRFYKGYVREFEEELYLLIILCDWWPIWASRISFILDKNRPLFGKLVGEIRGRLSEKPLQGIEVVGNWSMESPEATSFRIEFHNVPPEHSLCLQVLSEMASPAFWYAAKEVNFVHAFNYIN